MLTLVTVLIMLALGRLVGPVHPDVAAALLVLAAVCLAPAAWADLAPVEGEYRAAFPAAVAYSIATAVYLGGLGPVRRHGGRPDRRQCGRRWAAAVGRGAGGFGGGSRGAAGRPRGKAGAGMALRPEGRVMRRWALGALTVLGLLLALSAAPSDVRAVGSDPPTSLTIDKDGNFSFVIPASYTATGAAICRTTYSSWTLPPPASRNCHYLAAADLSLDSSANTYSGDWGSDWSATGRWHFYAFRTSSAYDYVTYYPAPRPFIYAVRDSGHLRYIIGGYTGETYSADIWKCNAEKTIPLSVSESGCSHKTGAATPGTIHTEALPGTWDASEEYYIYLRGGNSSAQYTWKSLIYNTDDYPSQRSCTQTLANYTTLTSLGGVAGQTVTASATLDGDPTTAPCQNWEGRPVDYYPVTVTGGGVYIRLRRAEGSPLDGRLVIWSSGDPFSLEQTYLYPGSNLSGGEAALAASLEAGTYVVGVLSQHLFTSDATAKGGGYTLTVERVQPRFQALTGQGPDASVTWSIPTGGAYLTLETSYKEASAAAWNTPQAVTTAGLSTQTQSITGLDGDTPYNARARFAHGAYATVDWVQLPITRFPAPFMNEDVESEETPGGRVRLTLNWAPGPAEVTGAGKEDKVTYEFRRQGNGEALVKKVANALQTNVVVDRENWRTLTFSVRAIYGDGTVTTVNYLGEEFEIPADERWYTSWSDPVSHRIGPAVLPVDEELPDLEPIAAVSDTIRGLQELVRIPEEDQRTETWALFLCLVLAVSFGGIAWVGTGATNGGVILGAVVFFSIWSGMGPLWFGVHPAPAFLPLVAAMMMGGVMAALRMRV